MNPSASTDFQPQGPVSALYRGPSADRAPHTAPGTGRNDRQRPPARATGSLISGALITGAVLGLLLWGTPGTTTGWTAALPSPDHALPEPS